MRKSNKPLVRGGLLVDSSAQPGNMTPLRIGSSEWHCWVSEHETFVYEGSAGHFTAQREMRKGYGYWYAYRRREGKLCKVYLGKSEELVQERLEQACAQLAGQPAEETFFAQPGPTPTPRRESWADSFLFPLTKFRPLVLPQKLVARPRLTQRINTPLALIYAPSGFGKSTLLSEWAQMCGHPVAWITLSEEDNEPARFWSALLAALRAMHQPGQAQNQILPPNLRVTDLTDARFLLTQLTNAFVQGTGAAAFPSATSPYRLGLVFDNVHHIQHPEIQTVIQEWLEQIPPGLQVAFASRTRPPFRLAVLRARGILAELDIEDLRFNQEEAAAFFSQRIQDPPLAYSEIDTLVKRTAGWATGLNLAVLGLSKTANRGEFIDSFSGTHDYLREYFLDSVFWPQPPDVQDFLLKTSILKQFSGDLCNAVTGQVNGAEMLAHLWQDNLFVVHSSEPGWYQYHDLFAETLRGQLQKMLPGEIPQLQRRAADWFRAQDMPEEAIYHLLAAQAWEEAAALIERMALHELEKFGEDSRLLRWLSQLPETIVQQHKTLLNAYVRLARVATSQQEVEQFLIRISANLQKKPAEEQTAAEQDVAVEIDRILGRVLGFPTAEAPSLSEKDGNAEWQMLDGILFAKQPYFNNLEEGEALARGLYETALAQRNLFVMMMVGGDWAHRVLLQGQYRRGERIAQQILQDALALRGRLPETASILLELLSRVHFERNELDQAKQLLQRAAEVDPNPTSSNMTLQLAISRAKIQSIQGDHEAAQASIQAARELQSRRPSGVWSQQSLAAYQALFAIRQGHLAEAEQLLNEICQDEPNPEPVTRLARAWLLYSQNRPAEVERELNVFCQAAQPAEYLQNESILYARVLDALALFMQRRINQARRMMTEAVRAAAPEGLTRPFLEIGTSGAELLALVLHTETLSAETRAFIRALLRQLQPEDDLPDVLSPENLSILALAASISVREQEVLRLVNEGFSNKEIASWLSISESTVATHLENIFKKLGVNSRVQAAAQARMLRLV